MAIYQDMKPLKLSIVPLLSYCTVIQIVTSLAKGGYHFGSISLSVCLLVSNITQKLINRFQ